MHTRLEGSTNRHSAAGTLQGPENALCKQTAADGSAVVESLGTDNRAPLQMQDCHTPQQTQLKVKQSFIFVFGRE